MSESATVNTTSTARSQGDRPLGKRAIALILALVVVVFLFALVVGGRNASEDEAFGGADAAAVQTLEDQGHEPWFEPIFAPAGGEIESGLFALQAGLGGIVLGYTVGRLRSRSGLGKTGRIESTPAAAQPVSPVGDARE